MSSSNLRLSENAKQILTEKPAQWGYRLFAQIVTDDIEEIKNIFQKGHLVQSSTLSLITALSSLEWMAKKIDEVFAISNQVTQVINSNPTDAFGTFLGLGADADKIIEHSRKVSALYYQCSIWSQDVASTSIDSTYKNLQYEIGLLANLVTASIEQSCSVLLKKTDKPQKGKTRDVSVSPTIKIPKEQFDKVKRFIEKEIFSVKAFVEEETFKLNASLTIIDLLSDKKLVEMTKNFIDKQSLDFYIKSDYIMSNDEFGLFVKFLKDKNPNVNKYTAYSFVYNVVIGYLAQNWEEGYGKYFSDINELNLETSTERYCSIEMINHEDVVLLGSFVCYLIQHKKFSQINDGYFDYLQSFLPVFSYAYKKSLDDKKYKNFVDKLKTPSNKSRYTIDDIDLMSGQEFENLIAELFSKLGYKSEVTKATGDQGVDVIVEKNGNKIGIQAKCYSGTVGNSAIQEVVAGKKYYRLDKVMVITNSFFTDSAQKLAHANSVVLWDRNTLKEKIDEIFNSSAE